MKAALITSIDFELYWGVHDLCTPEQAKDRLLATRSAIARILELFRTYEIHATWATVGFLFFDNRGLLCESLPSILPAYSRPELSPYPKLVSMGDRETEDPLRYAASVISEIARTPHQEIGSHTFSHFYCLEDGQSEAAFRSDLEAAVRAAERLGLTLRSLVFPRNQVHEAYIPTLRDAGFTSYRGAGAHWLYRQRKRSDESQYRRAMRLIDAYINISGHHSYSWGSIVRRPVIDLPASRLLRMYCRPLRLLEPLRISRICAGLRHAARKRHIYHLWFHPEELALDQKQNMEALRRILDQFASLRDQAEMESLTMAEAAARLEQSGIEHRRPIDREQFAVGWGA